MMVKSKPAEYKEGPLNLPTGKGKDKMINSKL